MPLKKQVVTMPFAKGINEKYADGMVPLGELTQAENVSFDKAGEIIKRGGFRKEENGIAFSASSSGRGLRNLISRHYAYFRRETPVGSHVCRFD